MIFALRTIAKVVFGLLWCFAFSAAVLAENPPKDKYVFGPKESSIEGSIGYTVLGVYRAHFEDFSGMVYFDKDLNRPVSVELTIRAESIKSKHPFNDNIVRSPQILDVKKYPAITFRSTRIEQKEKDYFVEGILTMHGVSRAISFPFSVSGMQRGREGRDSLEAGGKWVIRRKDFGVVWNKWLDHGGVIVGDHITVDWSVKAFREEA